MATAKHVPPGRKRQGTGGTRTQKPAPPPKARRGPTTSGTATGTTAASSSVTGLRVRMFRVGFGDFFLLSVPTSGGAKHILIDCGVHAKDLKSIGAAVTEMAKACGSELALLVMTHRHADHISGFYTCRDVFKQISVERVWMSWFEDPGNKTAVAFQAGLNALAGQLSNRLAARSDGGSEELAAMAENITGGMAADGRSANQGALDVLHNGFKNKPVYGYFQSGDKPTLPQDLVDAGLSAQILGPPIDASLVAQMTNTSQQYLAADGQSDDEHVVPFRQPFWVNSSAYPPKTFEIYDADEIKDMVDSVQPDILAAQAMAADKNFSTIRAWSYCSPSKARTSCLQVMHNGATGRIFFMGAHTERPGIRRSQLGQRRSSGSWISTRSVITAARTRRRRTLSRPCVTVASACARHSLAHTTRCLARPFCKP